MAERACLIMDDARGYWEPQVEDYGTLTDLTEAFDPDTLAHVAKGALSLAVVSTLVPGGSVLSDSVSGGGGSTPDSGVLGENRSGGGMGTPSGGDSGGSAGGQGSGGEEVLGAGGSGSGGRLPFTGFNVILTAAVGAALAGAGARARSALRRKRD